MDFTPISVSELTDLVQQSITIQPALRDVYVEGEISNFSNHIRSGHFYFSLKDKDSLVPTVMFRYANRSLNFVPKNGQNVIVRGKIDVYKKSGKYQLYVQKMEQVGAGNLHLKFEELKKELEKEGLFSVERKRPIPLFPQKLGVITGEGSAAQEDILKTLSSRLPSVEVVVCPCLVQGDKAKYQLEQAIKLMESLDVDTIILARGGGSIEDLWAFNEEIVARAIYNCKKPIITGVGHETDFTIADFVADFRAVTPTAAAQKAVPSMEELNDDLDYLRKRLDSKVVGLLEYSSEKVKQIKQRNILKRPETILDQYYQNLDTVSRQLSHEFKYYVEKKEGSVENLAFRLQSLSPKNVFARGYSVLKKERRLINSIKKVQTGDDVSIELQDGKLKCNVKEVIPGEKV
ncbi:exodeoxyribonuclease VII large subunit [Proteinivorax hydrogeniformans]|uniref:Exodeoxyribonuclease 7 large subunit n=1 Tax=Proteinivorax hydrogeniformans TaxID=1826727 RepID=A0AAU8HQS2_9FIRM